MLQAARSRADRVVPCEAATRRSTARSAAGSTVWRREKRGPSELLGLVRTGSAGGAGKSAAVAALSKPAERLGSRLAESAESLGQAGQKAQPESGGQQQGNGGGDKT